jgi:hypothetical protein
MRRVVFILRRGDPSGFPDDSVDLAIGQAAPGGELALQHRFAAARIADHKYARHR